MGIGDAASTAGRKKKRKKFIDAAEGKQEIVGQQSRNVTAKRPEYHNLDPQLLEDAEEFARIYDRLKKLEGKKEEVRGRLIEGIPEKGVKGKFVPLDDGRKVELYSTGGTRNVTKKALVEKFGAAGAEFWESIEPSERKNSVTVKD